jgi:glycosyltransferase involved in cell wall biosynthesis
MRPGRFTQDGGLRTRRYLLVTHIPFARTPDGLALLDSLWLRDLEGLTAALGPVRVAAPEVADGETLDAWGPGCTPVSPQSGIELVGFPAIAKRRDAWRWQKIRRILSHQVTWADVVQTSNFFPPYVGLSYAHDLATRLRKPTIFVVAEDFVDMLEWEWVRTAGSRFARWRRRRELHALDQLARRCTSSASLTFLHTPAAVERYRLSAAHAVAIRQPGHECCDVIGEREIDAKCAAIERGGPLVVVAAARHRPMKGLDLLIEAVAWLARRGIAVEARLYGAGESTGELARAARRLGVADRVSLPGSLAPGAALNRGIAEGHLFAMPHRTNDFGRAFFDALAGGTPVIAFRSRASEGTVRDGLDGFLTPLDDSEGLAAAIAHLDANRPLLARAARAARARALVDTRSAWYAFRVAQVRALLPVACAGQSIIDFTPLAAEPRQSAAS